MTAPVINYREKRPAPGFGLVMDCRNCGHTGDKKHLDDQKSQCCGRCQQRLQLRGQRRALSAGQCPQRRESVFLGNEAG